MRVCLLLVVLAAAPAAAQRLAISPDTLRFDGATERALVIRNEAAVPVSFDSLRFDRYSPEATGLVWVGYWWSTEPWVFGNIQCFLRERSGQIGTQAGRCEIFELDGRLLVPGEEITMLIRMSCPCRSGAAQRGGGFDDVAEFFSGGGPEPQRVPFLNALPTSEEAAPGGGLLRVRPVVPNPTRGAAVLEVTVAEPAAVSLDVSDALGRVVRSVPPRDVPAGAHRLPLDLTGLPPGVYGVRLVIVAPTGSSSRTQRVTVVR